MADPLALIRSYGGLAGSVYLASCSPGWGRVIDSGCDAGSAVDEGSVIKVGVRQDLPFLVVLQHVRLGLPAALLEQDVLRSHDVAGAEVSGADGAGDRLDACR